MSSTQEKLEQILDGIDKTEIEYENGWWETSTGAEFGAKKKQELTQLIDSAKREAELEWQIDQTTELARQNFMYRCLYGEAPLEYKGVNTLIAYQTYREGDDFRKNFARYVEQLAALLEQSEESV